MKKKKILIIGGTGFIGYHLAAKCKKLKWSVTSLSKNKPLKKRKLRNIKYKICDISVKRNLSKLTKNKYNYVVNLGGYIDHINKKRAYRGHYLGVKNLFNAFKNKGLESFIQIGSSAEYGTAKSPHYENAKGKPKLIYSRSKLLATQFLLRSYKKYNFPVTILRFYQVYGPKQSFDRFIPMLIKACIKNIRFPSSHGKQKRDFLYIDDAISAILKSLNNPKCIGKIINVGSGKPITLLKIMKYVQKKIGGGELLLGKIKLRKDEPMIIFPYLKNAKKILNWKSKISFNSGINRTIKEYKKQISKFS